MRRRLTARPASSAASRTATVAARVVGFSPSATAL
jgi:hypothetical protein